MQHLLPIQAHKNFLLQGLTEQAGYLGGISKLSPLNRLTVSPGDLGMAWAPDF